MPLASDYISQIRSLIHDLQAVDWTDLELLTIVNSARQRVALDAHCVRQFFQGLNVVPNVEQYPISGGIGGAIVTAGGSGYATVPTITFDPAPAGGLTATGVATVTGGALTAITMTSWGSGYVVQPNITIGGPGTLAAASSIALINMLDWLSVMPLWPGNTNARVMKWAPFTLFQAWARAYRAYTGYPQAWTNHDEANLIFMQPIPDQPYTVEIDAVTMPVNLATTASSDTQVILPFSDAVQWYGAYIAMIKLQNLEQADFFSKKYEQRIRAIRATRQDRRYPNIYQSSFRRMSRW